MNVKTCGFSLSKPYQPKPFHTKRAYRSSNRLNRLNDGSKSVFIECRLYARVGEMAWLSRAGAATLSALCACRWNELTEQLFSRKYVGSMRVSVKWFRRISGLNRKSRLYVRVGEMETTSLSMITKLSALCACRWNAIRQREPWFALVEPTCAADNRNKLRFWKIVFVGSTCAADNLFLFPA